MKQKILVFMATVGLMLVGTIGFAQMGHHGGGTPGNPGSGTSPANPGGGSGPGMDPGDMLGGMFGGMGNGMQDALQVASDGTVFAVQRSGDATNLHADLLAVRPSGTTGWKYALGSNGMSAIKVTADKVIVSVIAHSAGDQNSTDQSTLVALSLVSGSQLWKLDLDGVASEIEPFSGGSYVRVAKRNGYAGPTQNGSGQAGIGMAVSLLSVSTDGRILWTIPLTN